MIPPRSSNGASAVIQNASCSKPVGSTETTLPFSAGFFHKVAHRIRDAIGQDWLAVNSLSCLLAVESQQRSLRMNYSVADLYLLVFVHERFANIGIMAILTGGTSNEGRPI